MNRNPKIMIVAGEVSGDMHAARLVEAITEQTSGASFFGIGGESMRKCGVKTVYDVEDMAVMGISEVLRKMTFFRRALNKMTEIAMEQKPDCVVLVDYPGFNMRLATRIHKLGIKTVYYISPKVWAWNQSRIPKMARVLNRLITIFPFERKYFENTGLQVDYVGHPLVDQAKASLAEPLQDLAWNGEPRIAILPGSRTHEIARILPVMCEAAKRLELIRPASGFAIATPSPAIESTVRNVLATQKRIPSRLSVITGKTHQVLRQARAAMVASGTATLDASLMRCPMVIAYKVGILTSLLAHVLLHIEHVGLTNIIAGQEICRELLQEKLTATALTNSIIPLIDDTSIRNQMLKDLDAVNSLLGEGNCAQSAAKSVIDTIFT
ncbi:MAG: lipid-A-disaccharide synthase [Lentisphaerae bacterium]|nr:lipid-A-disaccharide synthase [Lentisphaerota bacterium]